MLNVLFAGTPECAVPSLEAVARSHRVVAVLTNPPASSGRSGAREPSPVAREAERLKEIGLIAADTPIITPERITAEVREAIAAVNPDVMACFAYGKIFGPKSLALFPLGALNLHPSLLPRWRGCAPVPAAILARDGETGLTVQKMALEMDAGDIVLQTRFALDGTETAESLLEKAARDGAPLLVEALDRLEAGTATTCPQNGVEATFSRMLRKEDGELNWTQSALDIDAHIRAFYPWPGAFTRSGEDVLLILKAHPYAGELRAEADAKPGKVVAVDKQDGILVQTGQGLLALEKLQWRTKKPLDWKSFLNGSQNFLERTLT